MNQTNIQKAVSVFAVAVGLTLASLLLAVGTAHSNPALAADSHHPRPAAATLHDAQRDLWVGHIFWVRSVVVETFAKNPKAANAAEKSAVANAKAIAGSIQPFYGKAASDQLFQLLAGHYGAVKEYLNASIGNSKQGQESAVEHLTSNARQIASFLSGANPHLPKDALEGLLLAHGGHHLQQIQEIQANNYAAETVTWGEMLGHIYTIADSLAAALAKHFPERV